MNLFEYVKYYFQAYCNCKYMTHEMISANSPTYIQINCQATEFLPVLQICMCNIGYTLKILYSIILTLIS